MNIFIFSPCLVTSAQYFFARDFRRANKQILELAQCLATVLAEQGVPVPKADGTPYKPTHKNHPVVRWLRESTANQQWASVYLDCLISEYARLRNRRHGCSIANLAICRAIPFVRGYAVPVHHGVGVPRTGDVYADYRNYLDMKLRKESTHDKPNPT
jgi:hypothetical protein